MKHDKSLRQAVLTLALLALLPCYALAAFIGSSLWTSLRTYSWTSAASFTWLDTVLYLNPYESAADTTGKAAHYIIGDASASGRVFTYPLSAAGYDTLTVQVYGSNAGLATANTYITSATDLQGYVNAYATIYPSGYIANSSIGGASYTAQYIVTTGGVEVVTARDPFHAHTNDEALGALWSPLQLQPLAGLTSRSQVANETISGSSVAVNVGCITTNQGGIYKVNLGGGVAYVMLEYQGLASPASVMFATTELIIRLD